MPDTPHPLPVAPPPRRRDGDAPFPAALWPLLALYGAMFAAYGVEAPFLPALMQEHGLRPAQLGLVLAFGTGVRLVSGVAVSAVADRLGAPRAALAACLAASAGFGCLYLPAYGLLPLLLVAVAHAAAQAPLGTLSDALAVAASRPPPLGAGVRYGWVRGAGSLSFTLAASAAGLAAGRFGLWTVVPLSAAFFVAASVAAARLPGQAVPTARAALDTALEASPGFAALGRLPGFPALLLVAAGTAGSHAFHEGFAVIAWRAAGTSDELSGLLWSEAVVAEVFVFILLGPWLVRRIGPAACCAVAAGAAALRWCCMALTVDPLAMLLTQPLHGLTFALQHLACMRLIAESVPPALAVRAQAAYAVLAIGLAKTAVTLACGPLYAGLGTGGFWAMAALAAATLPACFALRRAAPAAAQVNGR